MSCGDYDRASTLYRVWTDDPVDGVELAYIGITTSWPRRMAEHQQNAVWFWSAVRIEVQHLCCGRHARAAEAEAIRSEHPLYNVQHNDWIGV